MSPPMVKRGLQASQCFAASSSFVNEGSLPAPLLPLRNGQSFQTDTRFWTVVHHHLGSLDGYPCHNLLLHFVPTLIRRPYALHPFRWDCYRCFSLAVSAQIFLQALLLDFGSHHIYFMQILLFERSASGRAAGCIVMCFKNGRKNIHHV